MLKKLSTKRRECGGSPIGDAAKAAYHKLNEYYNASQAFSYYAIATICNLRLNLNVFQVLWPDETEKKKQLAMRTYFETVYTKYSRRAKELRAAKIEALIAAESVGIVDLVCQPDSEDEFYVSQNRTVSDSEWVK